MQVSDPGSVLVPPWVWMLQLLRDSGQLDLTSPVAAKWTGTKCASPSGDALIIHVHFFVVVVWATLANVSPLTNNTFATYAVVSILKKEPAGCTW